MPFREYIAENILDANFLKLLTPVHLVQLFLGSNCVEVSGNRISPIKWYQNLYTIIWIGAVSASLYWCEWAYYNSYYNEEKTLFYTFAFGLFVQYVSYLCNIIHARFFKSTQTVQVIMKIQKIDRSLKKMNVNYLVKSCESYINIVWIAYTIASFGTGFVTFAFYNVPQCLLAMPLGCGILTVYLELIIIGSCIYYLAIRLKILNEVIRKQIDNRKRLSCGIQKFGELIRCPTVVDGEICGTDMVRLREFTSILTSILKLFHDISNLFTFQLLNVVTTVFIWTFLVIESTVVGLRSKLVPTLSSVILILWIVFYFLQLTAVAFSCDWFSKQVKETRRLVVNSLSVYSEDKDVRIRKTAWELLQLLEFEEPKFSVYGIFVINMTLPLKLVSVITTNVLVLIQYTSNALNTN